MKKYFIIFVVFGYVLAPKVFALEPSNSGFIPGQIWYSENTLKEGDLVNIYTAVWNDNRTSLSAKVEFYDKNVLLGSRTVTVPANKLQEVSISWKVTSGDHTISAKIVSPSITSGGKKQIVTLSNNTTDTSHKFVPVVLNTIEGKPATSGDVVKSELDKATSSLDNIVPTAVSEPIRENVGAVEDFRTDTFSKITQAQKDTRNKIDELTKQEEKAKNSKTVAEKKNSIAGTEKPINYIKLFLLGIVSFIFGSKLVFFLVIFLILFLIIRAIYRKIRNR